MAADDCKLLRALMTPRSKEFVQMITLRVIPLCMVAPRGTKARLIDEVIDFVKHRVQDMYPVTLALFTKDAIDSILPRKGKTKRQSIEMVIELDQTSNAMALAIVPLAEQEDGVIVPTQKKARKRMGRLWRDLAKRKLTSRSLRKHMMAILSADGAADKTVGDVHCEVINRLGVYFGPAKKRNMCMLFHKTLGRLVKKHILAKLLLD